MTASIHNFNRERPAPFAMAPEPPRDPHREESSGASVIVWAVVAVTIICVMIGAFIIDGPQSVAVVLLWAWVGMFVFGFAVVVALYLEKRIRPRWKDDDFAEDD